MEFREIQKQRAVELHSLQAEEFDRRYRSLDEDAYQTCFNYSRLRLNSLLDSYLPQHGDGLRLLDVGCGTGHHLAELRRRGFEIAGIDGSADMLAQARTVNPGADLRLADVEKIPFADNSFDLIICIEVLRYLPTASLCLEEMARVLKPGGICLATAAPLLNLNGYWVVNRVANLMRIGNLVRLKQFFTTSSRLRQDFEKAGFSTLKIHGVYIGPINWVERLVPSALPRLLKNWERIDTALADRVVLREFSNMFLVRAVKKSE